MKERLIKIFEFIKSRKWLKRGIVLLLIITILFVWQWNKRNAAVNHFPEEPLFPTCYVDRGDVKMVIYATGNVEELNREEINPNINAKVVDVLVEEGQEVKAGDLLFFYDDSEVSLTYAKERITYEKLKRELGKELEALKSPLIYSNASGVITKIMVQNGSEVQADTIVAKVEKTDYLELRGYFNSTDVKAVYEGQKVEVFIQDFLTYLPATVKRVDRRGQGTTGGGLIHGVTVEVSNPGALMEGNQGYIRVTANSNTIRSIGMEKLKKAEEIDIKAGKQGIVKTVHVREGDSIDANNLLISLDSVNQQYVLEEKRLELKLAELSFEQKSKEIAKYYVYAGIDGIITELNVKAGEEVSSGKPAVVISNMSELKMKVRVLEEDIQYIKVGQTAEVYANAYGDEQFIGVVSKVAERGKIEGSSVFFEVEVTITEPKSLKPGMAGDTDIVVMYKENVLRLPLNAITIEDDGIGTIMIKGLEGMPEHKQITIGIEGDDYIEIIDGLNEGDEVLIIGGGDQFSPGPGFKY